MNDPHTDWTRRRLRMLLGAIATTSLLLAAGVVWSVLGLLAGGDRTGDGSGDGFGAGSSRVLDTSLSAEDQLAGRSLPVAPLDAAQPGTELSSSQTGTIVLPLPTLVGPAGVATGYPHTPSGALGQLAAIDTAALSSASVRGAQEVIAGWAAPGGPTEESWSGVAAVAAVLEAAGVAADGDGITLDVDAKMGFVKGTIGDDFVIPCIDFVFTAALAGGQPQQVAVADCQRMVWQDQPPATEQGAGQEDAPAVTGRWVIGPGEEPAAAPSLWPGCQASFDAGYQWLEVPQQ